MTTSAAKRLALPQETKRTTRRTQWIVAFLFLCLVSVHSYSDTTIAQTVSGGHIAELRGQTMGTTYMVKIFGDAETVPDDLRFGIDAELRRVNDQMSTYLKHSEVSRFNASESTDWFPVSPETAMVVAKAVEISRLTEGSFDVTVGPLVNAWNFGPGKRNNSVPSDDEIKSLMASVGYKKLSVRDEPSAIRKSAPGLQIDLSAIAKGHGVDRIVELLDEKGFTNVFVEIGGEVRTTGSKAGVPWMVGIQKPDAVANAVQIAHKLQDQAIATSGDYRNFFEANGKRYSHTIDTTTGRPVTHDTASVSVIAANCMTADGWATALNSMNAESAMKIAADNQLVALVINRNGEDYSLSGTGELEQYAAVVPNTAVTTADGADAASPILPVVLLTGAVFALVLGGMAVGVIFGRKAISGSCGGLNAQKNEDGSTSCSLCSNPSDACKELRDQMQKPKPKLDPLET